MNILYTTEAVVEGGRAGHGRTSDGRLAVELSVPKEIGGEGGPGTNPEQLFAVGYAACFHSELLRGPRSRRIDASDNSTVTAPVGVRPSAIADGRPSTTRIFSATEIYRRATRYALLDATVAHASPPSTTHRCVGKSSHVADDRQD